ncbi:hypothetical protein POTOM_053324 [Populus tomentosa]|uniref:Uncharacterized protein n=1 Tax=Populus tomentosa TaxID=118781 RepID=A0A8X7XXX8_POPTO|nr:hypothetical protein POTOM_053324 [Populus tomentosa]
MLHEEELSSCSCCRNLYGFKDKELHKLPRYSVLEHKCNSLGAAKILLGFWTCFTRTQFHQLSLEIFLRSTQLASSHSSSLGISKYPVLPLSLVRVREECKERQNLNIFGCKQLLRTVTALCLFRKAIRALQIL